METLWHDIRYAIRMLLKSPGFTAIAVLTLALGIGANTAIFSLLDQVLLRRLPVERPDELVVLRSPGPIRGHGWTDGDIGQSFSYPMYKELRDRNEVFSGLLARFAVPVSVSFRGQTERAAGELVSGNYFQVLGVRPALGRTLNQEDDRVPGANPVIVLSHGYWMRHFGGDRGILNQAVVVNAVPMTVVGVAAPGFTGVQLGQVPDVFIPMMMKAQITPHWNALDDYNDYWLAIIGRLKPGMTSQQAEAGIAPTYRALLEGQLPLIKSAKEDWRQRFLNKKLLLDPGSRGRIVLQRDSRGPLLMLMTMVGLVLLIACSNVANLLIARGTARYREFAIRLALGASRWRVARQLLMEGLLCSLIGGIVGLVVASWTADALVGALPADFGAEGISAQLSMNVLGFNFAVAALAGILFGLAPALRTSNPDLAPTLKDQSGTVSAGVSMVRFRKGLVVAQMALTLLLLIVAGMFVRSLQNLNRVDLGLRPERLVAFSVAPELNGYTPARSVALFDQIRESVGALPGIQGVSAATVPVLTDSTEGSNVTIEGYRPAEDEDVHFLKNWVGPTYFSTMGIPLLMGRELTAQDAAGSPKVALINETAAKKYFAGRSPIGSKFAFGSGDKTVLNIEIVGVVKDNHHATVREKVSPFVYMPYAQKEDLGDITFYVRTAQRPEQIAPLLRREVQRLDADLPIYNLKTMETQINELLFSDRVLAFLSGCFGFLAALLAMIGVYGVLAYMVVQRTREIGIRVALGAGAGDIRWLILRDVVKMALVGGLVGVPAAYGVARFAQSLLYGVNAGEVWIFVAGTVLMALVALLAGYVPAWRATRVDPITALRYE